jgi:small subunit ribosomal protein S15
MPLTKEITKTTTERFRTHATDTGSSAVQIALITERINQLTAHFKSHGKDYGSRQGLLKLVGSRRRLLNYLKSEDRTKYRELIDELKLRR